MENPTGPTLAAPARIFWIMLGPAIMLLLAMSIAERGGGWFTPHDWAFLAVVALVPLARWYEFHAGDPRTSTGDPATPAQLQRFVLIVVLVGAALWLAANLIGNELLVF